MLDDVQVTHLEGDRAEVRLRDTVCTVQPNPHKQRADRLLALAYDNESRTPEGPDLEAATLARYRAQEAARGHDAYTYTLPTGESYSHPDKRGALHMCRKWFVEAGIVLVPFDHSHMNADDRTRAHELHRARDRMTGPRIGDFVQLAGQVRPVTRICGFGGAGKSFALTSGGSFSLPALGSQLTHDWAGYSGGLDWRPEYQPAGLIDSGRQEMGRFWFFSGGRMAAYGGVDVALPCRVYTLEGDSK